VWECEREKKKSPISHFLLSGYLPSLTKILTFSKRTKIKFKTQFKTSTCLVFLKLLVSQTKMIYFKMINFMKHKKLKHSFWNFHYLSVWSFKSTIFFEIVDAATSDEESWGPEDIEILNNFFNWLFFIPIDEFIACNLFTFVK
jgi:hypothetical protein